MVNLFPNYEMRSTGPELMAKYSIIHELFDWIYIPKGHRWGKAVYTNRERAIIYLNKKHYPNRPRQIYTCLDCGQSWCRTAKEATILVGPKVVTPCQVAQVMEEDPQDSNC